MNFSSYKLWVHHTPEGGEGQGTASALATCCKPPGISFQPGRQQVCESAPWFSLCQSPKQGPTKQQNQDKLFPAAALNSSLPYRHWGQVPRPQQCWQGNQEGGLSLGDVFTHSRSGMVPRSGTSAFKQQQPPPCHSTVTPLLRRHGTDQVSPVPQLKEEIIPNSIVWRFSSG